MDPIVFGAGVSESGQGGVAFPVLNDVATWYKGIAAPANPDAEQGRVSATTRTLPEEGGLGTAAAIAPSGLQARVTFQGVWDVVFIDAFPDVAVPTPECSLVLQVFEADGETIAWEVGTAQYHPNPYLCLPDNYGAQEIDIIAGAATIGQVEVTVIDKAQTPGDQDSGWLTERLTDGAVPAIRGRRCKLIRFISPELGYVVIADGPADVPRLDDSFSAYKWVIRDVRDTERAIRAFTRSESWIFPMGAPNGWGYYTDTVGDPQWLVSPRDPIVGTYREEFDLHGIVTFDDYFPNGLDANWNPDDGDPVTSRDVEVAEDLIPLTYSEVEQIDLGGESAWGRRAWHTWPNIEILWRPEGSSGAWTVVNPAWMHFLGGAFYPHSVISILASTATGLYTYELPDTTRIVGSSKVQLRGPDMSSTWTEAEGYRGQLGPGTFPINGQRVELAVRYVGEPTETTPAYIEFDDDGVTRLTAGRLLQKLYDGEYSDRDSVTGDVVPTGIRYNEDTLLLMTTPVRLRVTEPVDDLRDWAEKKIYAPTGWVPSLDSDLAISPSSQEIPASFDGLPVLSDANVEPVPSWNAGETIINLLEFGYKRWYVPDITGQQAASIDNLQSQDVTLIYRSEESIIKKEEKVTFEGDAFAALGTVNGESLELLGEIGAALSLDRKLYVFDRYNMGAQTVEIPILRSASVATIQPGTWVVVDLSWLPDYVTMRRGTSWGGQIVAIHDVDCKWRVFLIEEAVPLVIS